LSRIIGFLPSGFLAEPGNSLPEVVHIPYGLIVFQHFTLPTLTGDPVALGEPVKDVYDEIRKRKLLAPVREPTF
jgi:hypothetical protein